MGWQYGRHRIATSNDSTELIRDLDPEETQKLLDLSIHIVMETGHRFEGTVNQGLGDSIMSIFGAWAQHIARSDK